MGSTDWPFEEITAKDSKSLFKPQVVALILTQSETKGPNIMTAAYWMVAGYSPFRYLLAASHKTHTHEILEENPEFVAAAPTKDMIAALTLSGKISGRELDKIDHLDLETVPGEVVDVPMLKNAVGNIECRVMESFEYEGYTYYIAGVEKAHVVLGGMDGRILSAEAEPLAYMGSDWKNESDKTKHRYYVDFDEEDLEAYPGDKIIKTLPEHLQEKFD